MEIVKAAGHLKLLVSAHRPGEGQGSDDLRPDAYETGAGTTMTAHQVQALGWRWTKSVDGICTIFFVAKSFHCWE
jgi:hypothetical protein